MGSVIPTRTAGLLAGAWRVLLAAAALAEIAGAQIPVAGKVVDENGVAVTDAHIEIRAVAGDKAATAVSGKSGDFKATVAAVGEYSLRVERQGFFLMSNSRISVTAGGNHVTITLNHLQELAESVSVVYSPPAIDLQEPDEHRQLDHMEILSVPYPAPHDIRNALPLFQSVVQDTAGRLHVNGGATGQTNFTLNGFNITDPVTGRLGARMDIEGVRSLDLQVNRFSADTGKGSAGSLDIQTKMGDDRWRYGATNFIPSVSTNDGIYLNKWTPRFELSGPIQKSRAWFHNGLETYYDEDVVTGLPRGQNRIHGFTGSDLARTQVNLTPANIFTASFLVNYSRTSGYGLSFLDPQETTTKRVSEFYMGSVRDQVYMGRGALLDLGYAETRGVADQVPLGNQTYEISPYGRRGNYFVDSGRHYSRREWLANVFFPSMEGRGSHQFKMGIDLDMDSFHQKTLRHDYRVLRTDETLARYVTFAGNNFQQRTNFTVSQYVMDRWTPREGITVEGGLRTDWDQVIRDVLWSPRVAVAWAPKLLKDTKIAAGIGIYHDALTLGPITQHQDQVSYSTFFDPAGSIRSGPVPTMFLVSEHDLRAPRYRTISATFERKLPLDLYGKASYVRRRGSRGFTFVNGVSPWQGGLYQLRNWRRDSYDALEITARRTFGRFEWAGGYTRSSARASAVVDYSLEDPIFGLQGPGPLAWDAPNRFLTWGWVPVPKRLLPRFLQGLVNETDAAYLVEYRTGYPFSVVNEEGFMVGPPNSQRLPGYFNINLHFEKRFHALNHLWGWRFGFNNITNNGNPNYVNNNIDSPLYLTYGRGQSRAFTIRFRLLGKR